jgi:galactosamine-6-phosphate isomerase
MNEPSNFLIPDPHVSHLTKSSLKHGMLKSLSRKPKFGLTLGLGDILKSRKIILLVSGSAKRQILKRMLKPQVSNKIPASFLWLHSDVTIFCDAEALP